MEGYPLQGAWAAMAQAAQRGHLLGSTAIFPLEVEQRLRGDSTRALVQGLSALNEDLFKGHAGLREALTAEVKARSDCYVMTPSDSAPAHGIVYVDHKYWHSSPAALMVLLNSSTA